MKVIRALILSAIAVIVTASAPADVANAMLRSEYERLNDVLFYNPNFQPACTGTAGTLSLGASAAAGASGGGLSARLMAIRDPVGLANAINQWITQQHPDSPLRDKGQFAVAGGQRAGINPILVIIISKMETAIGTVDAPGYRPRYLGIVRGGVPTYNGYGRTATRSQPHVGGSDRLYYKWDSWEQSLYSTTSGVTDMYQYIAQVYANEIEQGIEAVMMKYAPPFENDTSGYIANLQKWASEIYALAGDSIDISQLGVAGDAGPVGTSSTGAGCTNTAQPGTAGANGWDIDGSNGMVIYYQNEEPWVNQDYGIGKIGPCGCGPTSMAMAVATLTGDRSVNPKTMSDFFVANGGQIGGGSCGSNWIWDGGGPFSSQYGVQIRNLGTNLQMAREAVGRGSLVLMSQGPGMFTSSGHIMLIRGVAGDNFTVADPQNRSNTENSGGFTQQQISASLMGLWEISKPGDRP